ncbi:hypothetical protein [Enterococcus alishanensis]|uniref:Uncharacterized protein n=1 Tax=Enterococcus alishanensis TaxID=1303817 RepID=A0ABS6TB05_9ENTE|nr:hypothetical protein [Enterococcus alishanensis]MBV7390078.1 hypothetical protein [Enterococcus alishanensis]
MGKKYVVTEESGCGCWSVIGFLFLCSIFITIAPYLLFILIIAVIIGLIIYIPKMRQRKQHAAEEAELAERERQLELRAKRIALEKRERELNDHKEIDNDGWDDF